MPYIVPALIIAAAILLVGFAAVLVLARRLSHARSDDALAMLQHHLTTGLTGAEQQVGALREGLQDALSKLSHQMTAGMAEANKQVNARLENTNRVVGDVRQQLGSLNESSQRMLELGRDIAKLESVLQPPKLRGGLGELFLKELLAQILPHDHFTLQYRFKGGETVDAVIRLESGMVPVDAKFPLENFRRLLDADSDEARKAAKRQFIRDVKLHIDAIASKYIRMDENTFDFALMYIPAENVYYETIIKDDVFGGEMTLFQHAMQRRVIPVSPHSFYAFLQTIVLGLRGMKVEQRSREVLEALSRLQSEFDRFADAFRLVGQHLDNAGKKFQDADKRFGKVETKVAQIHGLAQAADLAHLTAETPAPDPLPEA